MSKIFQDEHQMILRLPQNIADQINKQMDDKNQQMQEIELTPIMQQQEDGSKEIQFKFKYGDFASNASLVRLPCILESQKTLDQINFFKSNDICDMIYVHPNNEMQNYNEIAEKKFELIRPGIRKKNNSTIQVSSNIPKEKFVRHLLKNGLTAPTKRIKQRFYQKSSIGMPKLSGKRFIFDYQSCCIIEIMIQKDLSKQKPDGDENMQDSELKPSKRKYVRRM